MSWWGWIIAGAILLGAELAFVNAQFYLVFIGSAAIVVGMITVATPVLPPWSQWAIFAVLAIVSMVTFRSRIYRKLRGATRRRFTLAPPPGAKSHCQPLLPPARAARPSTVAPSGRCATTAILRFHPVHVPASQVCVDSRSSCGPTSNKPCARTYFMYTSYVFIALAIIAVIVVARTATVVPQQSAYVIENLGRYSRTLHAGFHILIPFVDRVAYRHSLKEQALDVAEQVCITRDNVQVGVDAVLYMQVLDPHLASYGITNYDFAISQLAQTTLRSEIGKIELDRTFEARGIINANVVAELDKASVAWGVKVMRYEIKNIAPPEGRAIRDGETNAGRAGEARCRVGVRGRA